MAKKYDARDVLSDFFEGQDVLRIMEIRDQFDYTYVPDEHGAVLRTVRKKHPEFDVVNTAHEIGHFVMAPLERLKKIDYGYKNMNGPWKTGAWLLEFDVIARQAIIMREKNRHVALNNYLGDITTFVANRGKTYILSVPGLRDEIDVAWEGKKYSVLRDHVRAQIEERVMKIEGGYREIVNEFHQKCTMLTEKVSNAG